jgi:mannose-6-phosphate isomerase-like protein (cupin superfamily)
MLHKKLPNHWALLSGSKPFDEFSFESSEVQIIYNCTDESWSDETVHYHEKSDEIYIVLEGALHILVDGKSMHISKDEYLCVPKGLPHKLIKVDTPHKSFVIRGPSIQDKVVQEN